MCTDQMSDFDISDKTVLPLESTETHITETLMNSTPNRTYNISFSES